VPAKRGEAGLAPTADLDDDRPPSDAALAVRASRGDAAAFQTLVTRHLASIVAIARRMLRDDAEAEDVAQEAMLRLWRAGGGLELGPMGARPWLRRVVANLCIDRIRAVRRTEVTDEVPEEEAPGGQLRGLLDRELSARVDAALKRLPERQRLALTLFHFEGLSQLEVAEIMGVSDEAVESLLARGRRTLKADLKEEWRQLLAD
jgi:RNA polymerase sigma-70 factor (ECF subfamily)